MRNPELRKLWEKFNKEDTLDLRTSSYLWAGRFSQEERENEETRLFIASLTTNETGPILDIGSSLFAETYLPYDKSLVSLDWTSHGFSFKDKAVIGDANKLPFLDNSFPIVLSKQLYGYMPEPAFLLKEMIRVLRPNGIFTLIDYEGCLTPYNFNSALPRYHDFEPEKVSEQLESFGINQPQITRIWTMEDYNIAVGAKIKISLSAIAGRLKPKRSI